jgi:enediyne biosynthesis protein E3
LCAEFKDKAVQRASHTTQRGPSQGESPILRRILGGLLAISASEVTVERRNFRVSEDGVRRRLEAVGAAFLRGYHAAFAIHELSLLSRNFESIEPDFRGFAFEGAAMAMTLLDCLVPSNLSRLGLLLEGPGAAHIYLVHVGVGWALARIPWKRFRLEESLNGLDPLFRWLAVDGYGFHEGYFHFPKYIKNQKKPAWLSPYALRIFDQGLGRSLWFVMGANVHEITRTIGDFGTSRRPDLWSGVGLACAYAGGVSESSIKTLRQLGDEYIPQLAQGAAFAAKARERAGNQSFYTELACNTLCGTSATEAAAAADVAQEMLSPQDEEPKYAAWQRHIQMMFAKT